MRNDTNARHAHGSILLGGRDMEALERQYMRHEHFVFRRIQDEMLLVPIKDNVGDMGCIYNLNDVGAFIWERMDGKNRLKDIKMMMAEEFDVSSDRAEEDLCEFVRQLEEIDAISYIAHPEGGMTYDQEGNTKTGVYKTGRDEDHP